MLKSIALRWRILKIPMFSCSSEALLQNVRVGSRGEPWHGELRCGAGHGCQRCGELRCTGPVFLDPGESWTQIRLQNPRNGWNWRNLRSRHWKWVSIDIFTVFWNLYLCTRTKCPRDAGRSQSIFSSLIQNAKCSTVLAERQNSKNFLLLGKKRVPAPRFQGFLQFLAESWPCWWHFSPKTLWYPARYCKLPWYAMTRRNIS